MYLSFISSSSQVFSLDKKEKEKEREREKKKSFH